MISVSEIDEIVKRYENPYREHVDFRIVSNYSDRLAGIKLEESKDIPAGLFKDDDHKQQVLIGAGLAEGIRIGLAIAHQIEHGSDS